MSIGTRLFTLFFGKLVGEDTYGNRYYQEKRPRNASRPRRWVLFKGSKEPSKVPSLWHSWLHHISDKSPIKDAPKPYNWQQEHTPNLTGTALAYFPPGHASKGGVRDKATGDYDAWTPPE